MATRKFTMVACIICLLDHNIWLDAETFIEYFESIARAGWNNSISQGKEGCG